MNLEDNEELEVRVFQEPIKSKAPLTKDQGSRIVLTKAAKEIFENWFAVYAAEDKVLGQAMSVENVVEFFKACSQLTRRYTIDADDPAIVEFFEKNDSDKDGKITQDEFLEFYRKMSIERPPTVWANIKSHNIDQNLKPMTGELTTYGNDESLVREPSRLPRHSIANNQDMIDTLFRMDAQLDEHTGELIWRTISQLKTNKSLYANVLSNNAGLFARLQEPDLLDKMPLHQLLYLLQIIKYLLRKVLLGVHRDSPDEVTLYLDKPKDEDRQPQAEPGALNADLEEESKDGQNNPQEKEDHTMQGTDEDQPRGNIQPSQGDQDNVQSPDDENKQDDAAGIKETVDQKKIREWKGQIKRENLELFLFQPAEQVEIEQMVATQLEIGQTPLKFDELHQRWLIDFLDKKGLNALINILNTVSGHKNVKLNFAESKCLHLTASILKILLIGCFSVNDAAGLSTNLVRKMSSAPAAEEEGQPQLLRKKSSFSRQKIEEEKKETKEEKSYKIDVEELVRLLESAEDVGLTNDILDNLNKAHLLVQLQSLFELVLAKENPSADDIGIVKEALNIWTSFVTYNPHLLEGLYQNLVEKDQVQQEVKRAHFVQVLVDKGLIGKNNDIQFEFKDSLLFICQNVKKTQLPEPPATFFLRVLLEKLNFVTTVDPNDTKRYFQLLHQLMSDYFNQEQFSEMKDEADLFNEKELLHAVLNHLTNYKSHETKDNPQEMCDNTLVGLLSIATALLQGAHSKKLVVFEGNQAQQITDLVLQKLLFGECNLNEEVLSQLTKEEDLLIFKTAAGYKCHHEKSREAAYQLFLFLVENYLTQEEFEIVVRHYWTDLITRIERPREKNFDPAKRKRADNGYAGLVNQHATCYMNSMLQQFYHVPIFRYSMINSDDHQPPDLIGFQNRNIDDNLLHQTQRMFSSLDLTDRISYNTRDFCYSYKDGGQPVNVRLQQDASEFLNVIFDRLEFSLQKSPGDKYLCQNVFQGEQAFLTVCNKCGHRKEAYEPFYPLSVQVQQKGSVQEGLEHMTKGEIIADFNCEACGQRVDITKKTVVKKLPNVLIVHLNRIIFDIEKMDNVKVNDKMSFPTTLNMRPYMLNEVIKKDQEQRMAEMENAGAPDQEMEPAANAEDHKVAEEGDADMIDTATNQVEQKEKGEEEKKAPADEENAEEIPDEEFEYRLVGVVIHMGSARAGHYISYINVDRDTGDGKPMPQEDPSKQKWYEFNDECVKEFMFQSEVEAKCFGGKVQRHYETNNLWDDGIIEDEQNHNAYMLIYEKHVKVPFKIDIQEATIEAIKTGDEATIGELLPNCFKLYPNLLDQVKSGHRMHYDAEKNEHYALVDQSRFNQVIPVQRKVGTYFDNQKYLIEKQVFSPSFYETTTQLFETVIVGLEGAAKSGGVDVSAQCGAMFKILDHLIFELIANVKNPKGLALLTDQMLRVAFSNRDTMKKMVDERIFVPEAKLEKDERDFFGVLVHHAEPEVRQMASDMLQHVFARTFINIMNTEDPNEKEEHQQLLDRIADGVMKMMQGECEKVWWKLVPYFDFFEKLIIHPEEDGAAENSLSFISKEQRAEIVNYFRYRKLVRELFNLMSKAHVDHPPPFKKPLNVIMHLVCQQPLFLYDYEKDIEAGDQPIESAAIIQMIQDDNTLVSPFYKGTIADIDESCFLDIETQACLYMDTDNKRMKKWLEILLKDDSNTEDIATLVGHLCWKNLEFSKRAGKTILKGCNKNSWKDLEASIVAATYFLTLQDEWQFQRLEMILGFPMFNAAPEDTWRDKIDLPKIKAGAQKISKIADQTYDYSTTLIKRAITIHESFFQNIFKYKDHLNDTALAMLDGLITCMLERDSNGVVLKYLLTCEGPAYTCNRFWDWIEPHIHAKVTDQYSYYDKSKKERLVAMLANIAKIKEQKPELFVPGAVMQGLGVCPSRENFVVWGTLQVKQQDQVMTLDPRETQFFATIAQLDNWVTKSDPQGGLTNEALTDNYEQKWFAYGGYQNVSVVRPKYMGQIVMRPPPAAKDPQEESDQVVEEVKGGQGGQGGQSEPNQKKEEDVADKDPTTVADFHPSANNQDIEEDINNREDEEAMTSGDRNNVNIPGLEFGDQKAEGDKVKGDPAAEPDQEAYYEIDSNKATADSPLLLIVVHNKNYRHKQFLLRWNQDLRELVNFRMPHNDLCQHINGSKEAIVFAAQKLRLKEEWGPIQDSFTLEIYDKDEIKQARDARRNEYRQQQQAAHAGPDQHMQDEPSPMLQPPAAAGVSSTEAAVEQLKDMGFPEADVRAALRRAGGDVDMAMNILLA